MPNKPDELPDLVALAAGPHLTPEQRRQLARPASSKKRGHFYMPGTGPEGETCGTCQHCYPHQMARKYYKCYLNRAKWTNSYGTDIRKRDQACKYWESKDANQDDSDGRPDH